eukprot:TRINITY_DN10728_c0_g1_i4.p2 TRINITY_DN10728_c0_g1~~TRINITY_DN10728_c0_g1_i4.p2  ORF type:complete len:108 (+),score=24.38 TRINITY_DN10728_c0_g1_i4:303-626(+)
MRAMHELPDIKLQRVDVISPAKEVEEQKLVPPRRSARCNSYPRGRRRGGERDLEKIEVTGERTKVVFQFIYHPEYLKLGSTIVIADSALRAFGEITRIFYDLDKWPV